MKLLVNSFRGEVPLLTPRALPDNAAQLAINARLQTGDLESWRQFLLTKTLANTGPVQTIYKLDDVWLAWNDQVDVARGLIPGDDTFMTYLTCPALYTAPQFITYALATSGAEPYPFATRTLGVDKPQVAATLVIGADTSDSATFSVDVTDLGADFTQWVKSGNISEATFNGTITQSVTEGSPTQPSYQLSWRDYGDVTPGIYLCRDFGIAAAAVVVMTARIQVNTVAAMSRIWMGVMRSQSGVGGISVQIDQSSSGSWYMSIGTANEWGWGQGQRQSTLLTSAAISGLASMTWFKLRVNIVVKADGSQTVTATVLNLSDTVLSTLTSTMHATLGDWCGFGSGFDQLGATSSAWVDDIHVTASGTAGYTAATFATAYLWVYENDLGQQSAPSVPTDTILRPDGVSVTVTTPTTLPTGYSVYGITNKVIFRAVSGDGGTVFKFVARITLATATYVDILSDANTGPAVLESEDWAPPPADLQDIIALPNNTMAGFFKNQLCFSAKGFPHAWPVKYRLTTDTDIVAIENIDTTVVVGTKSFVYTATGSSPESYSMSKPGEAQSCVSKLGMVFLDGAGVAFPSPDGYQLCSGSAGSLRNLTQGVFTRRQWAALNPESIIAAVHDGVLHFFYDNDATPALDFIAPFELTFAGAAASGGWAEIGLVFTDGDIAGENSSPLSESLGSWTVGAVTPPVPVWVRATVLSTTNPENVTFGGDAVDTWLPLTTNRTWRLDDVNQGGGSYLLGIQFSSSAGGSNPTPAAAGMTHSLNLDLVSI